MSDFRSWQMSFYKSKKWIKVRNQVRKRDLLVCQHCKELIVSKKMIVDHITEITPQNKNDKDVLYNMNNLQLLCITCHNKKTFTNNKKNVIIKEVDYNSRDKF